jgi:hypothetical protein
MAETTVHAMTIRHLVLLLLLLLLFCAVDFVGAHMRQQWYKVSA